MGLAASQGRLLSITARMSDVEFSSQQLQQQKIRLSMSTEELSRQYTNALNQKKMVGTTFTNGTAGSTDLTYNLLTGPDSPLAGDYCLTDANNQVLVTTDMKSKYIAAGGDINKFLASNGVTAGYVPASADYKPAVPASADYKPAVPASADYKPAVPASADYKPAVPASADYKPASADYKAAVPATDCPVGVSGSTLASLKSLWGDGSKFSISSFSNSYTSNSEQLSRYALVFGSDGKSGIYGILKQSSADIQAKLADASLDEATKTRLNAEKASFDKQIGIMDNSGWNATGAFLAAGGYMANRLINGYDNNSQTVTNPDNVSSLVKNIISTYTSQAGSPQIGNPQVGTPGTPQVGTPAQGTPGVAAVGNSTYYTNMFNRMTQGYTTIDPANQKSVAWLDSQLKNGGVFLEKFDATSQKFVDTDTTSSSEISEQADNSNTAVVEAKYDADMQAIQTKDKRLDMNIKQLDTEHSALQTEVDSVKKVIEKNIESSFKSFG